MLNRRDLMASALASAALPGIALAQSIEKPKLTIAVGITAAILVAEVIGAWWTNSHALLVDAGYMLTAASGLLMALIATNLALRPPTPERTWGWRRAEVLAAGAQAAVLLAVGVYAFVEGVRRLYTPPEVTAGGLLMFGIAGLVGSIVSMLVLSSGRGANLNMRAAFLEVVNDAQMALLRIRERYAQDGVFAADDEALHDVPAALDLYDEFLNHCTPRMMFGALTKAIKRMKVARNELRRGL